MGNSRSRSRTNSTTTENFNGTSSTPGTQFGVDQLSGLQQTVNTAQNTPAFTGDARATANAPAGGRFTVNMNNQYTPTELFAQRTTGDSPTLTDLNWVDRNASEGWQAGMANAQNLQGQIQPLVNQQFDYWQQIMNGGGANPYLEQVIQGIQGDAASAFSNQNNALAQTAGVSGAFGGYDQQRAQNQIAATQADRLLQTTTGLRYDDFNRTSGMIQGMPANLAAIAGLSNIPAELLSQWGGQRQADLAGAQATADTNTQNAAINAWNQGTLADWNAQTANQNQAGLWDMWNQINQSNVQNDLFQAQFDQENAQVGLDNNLFQYQNQIANNQYIQQAILAAMGGAASIPGSTQSGSSSGTQNSTTTTSQSASPLQSLASLGSIGMGLFGPGGMFAGGGGQAASGVANGLLSGGGGMTNSALSGAQLTPAGQSILSQIMGQTPFTTPNIPPPVPGVAPVPGG